MKFVFCDIDENFCQEINKNFGINSKKIISINCDIRQLREKLNGENSTFIWVSPANSYGWMNGGIDGIYSKMFPGIEEKVKKATGGYLEVGKSILIPIDNRNSLISAPTMEFPSIVKDTSNAYLAMMSILNLLNSNFDLIKYFDYLVVPGLCTGVGMMTPHESAKQVYQSFVDINTGSNKNN